MDDRAETAPKEMDDYLDQIVPQVRWDRAGRVGL